MIVHKAERPIENDEPFLTFHDKFERSPDNNFFLIIHALKLDSFNFEVKCMHFGPDFRMPVTEWIVFSFQISSSIVLISCLYNNLYQNPFGRKVLQNYSDSCTLSYLSYYEEDDV